MVLITGMLRQSWLFKVHIMQYVEMVLITSMLQQSWLFKVYIMQYV
jgi:hypothetical protein